MTISLFLASLNTCLSRLCSYRNSLDSPREIYLYGCPDYFFVNLIALLIDLTKSYYQIIPGKIIVQNGFQQERYIIQRLVSTHHKQSILGYGSVTIVFESGNPSETIQEVVFRYIASPVVAVDQIEKVLKNNFTTAP